MNSDINNIKIPVGWLLERVKQSGDVRQMEMVRRMVSDYMMFQMNADLLAQMDEAEMACRKAQEPQLINISNPSGDVILTGGKKEEKNFNENTETRTENL